MKTIVAIGGGEIARHETLAIDKEIIRLSRKKRPTVLFIPTASSDAQGYIDTFTDYYGTYLNCDVQVLKLIKQHFDPKETSKIILSSDIIYVGGGNTLRMMKLWRKLGIDKILIKAYHQGIILSGISAGAICWFKFGNSDSRRFKNPNAPLIKVRGLGIFNALLCPHYHSKEYDKDRRTSLKEMMEKTAEVALAIDDFCACVFIDDTYKVITSKNHAATYKVYWRHSTFHHEKIQSKNELIEIRNLLSK